METLDKNKSGNPMEGEARGNMSIEEFLKKDEQKDLLRFLTAGSVDDGKSTLIGRLLFDSKKLYEDQLDDKKIYFFPNRIYKSKINTRITYS